MTAPGSVRNDPDLVERFVDMFTTCGTRDLISDLETQVGSVRIAGKTFPVTVNNGENNACYLCSPSRAYVDYALDETRNFAPNPVLQMAVRTLIQACRPLVHATGLDRQVQANNWLYSTNPMPFLTEAEALALRDELTDAHPQLALVIRSLNEMADAATMRALRAAGFVMMASRQIYIVPGQAKLSRNMRSDRALIRSGVYSRVGNEDICDADYARCETLYNMLYLQKYTQLNPHYSARYIREMHKRAILQLAGFRDKEGRLVAVTGLFENGRTLTQPIVGYDTSLPIETGLYRMIMAVAQDHAFDKGLFFNMSAGAAAFKKRRNAKPVIEYSAVYVGHLPAKQRLATRMMAGILRRVGIPLLQRFEL